jgi:hypothetical protein
MSNETFNIHTKYIHEQNCQLRFDKYQDGSTAMLIRSSRGDPLIKVTAYLPKVVLEEDQILVKDYSENEGILQCLIELEIIEELEDLDPIPSGYAILNVCKLLVNPADYQPNWS